MPTPEPLLDTIIAWTASHPTWSGALVFGVALLESLFLVGIVVPGAAVMLTVGALIALDALALWPTLAWAVAGAIAGDGISFWLGYRFRGHLRQLRLVRRYARLVDRGEAFFARHGGKSIVFGRFVGPVRAVVPTVAGMMAMSPLRFTLINVASAIAWAPAYILPGMVFGASLELASEVAVRLVIVLVLTIAVLLLTRWLIRRIFAVLQPRAERLVDVTLSWSRNHPWLGPVVAALIDPRYPESRALVLLAGLLLAGGIAFFGILSYAVARTGTGLDAATFDLMRSLRTPWSDQFMVGVTMLGGAAVYLPVSAAALVWLLWKRNIPAAAHWAAAVAFGWVLTQVLKVTLQVPRPTELYTGASSFSFPSAHATMGMVTYGFLAVLVSRELSPRRRRIPYVVAGALIALIAMSRVYLGAHWLSDVAGGLTLGLAWVALLGIAYRRHFSPRLAVTGFVTFVSLAILAAGSVHIALDHSRELQRYALRHPVEVTTAAQWWTAGWRELPTFRNDLRGRHEQPLNVQWAGPCDVLARHLLNAGWQRPVPVSPVTALQWFNLRTGLSRLPVLPQVHAGRHETLLLTHPADNANHQWVLRLWPANLRLGDTGQPVWIGSASRQVLTRSLGILAYPTTGDAFMEPMAILQEDLEGLDWRVRQRPRRAIETPAHWDGSVVLIRAAKRPIPGGAAATGSRGEDEALVCREDHSPAWESRPQRGNRAWSTAR